ncbi:peroxiredoxin [Pseudaminobacter sp. 19-2017]|uniref:thioredoxin-dependent peroxiredoxin n=1 Tax=Pseudaminobacter soli (ex Zhang et al. 2022) TaxID=2831468 RepID=A0A942DVB0_9HYPH|nr:peroxiredoxin [Pseudaminobacter soli]MBS3647281.1 peroxiredoxin [Pseudaminobacter soli]
MAELLEGDMAPPLSLPLSGGGQWDLQDLRGRTVVLYFYPKDDTEACTAEANAFTAKKGDFEAAGATIVGVSPDSPARHARFAGKHAITIDLASDENHEAAERYGVWVQKNMYGRSYMGVERSTFLIDPQGRIARIWRKVRVKGHVEEVLEAARQLDARS